uniref:Fic family protein n=1 Tax=Halomonas sp. TaxID=1486246 RepID=UPI0026063F12|nr:Fic family protein [Halomonas sp.]
MSWIWQQSEWPEFHWNAADITPRLRRIHFQEGRLLGKAEAVDADSPAQSLDTLLANIVASSAIENERLNVQSVRSSLARRLGVRQDSPYPSSDRSEGLASMMIDAIEQHAQPLSLERLCQWHRWLFPAGGSEFAVRPLIVGNIRGEEPMQVVSGRPDNPTVHFEAPDRQRLEPELMMFIDWFNSTRDAPELDPLIRAALCHLWFVTLHPFDDGNGRITRALTDMALAQGDHQSIRLYAMSTVILDQRHEYYRILEQTQRGSLDVSIWIQWFLDTLEGAMVQAQKKVDRTIHKTRFWELHRGASLSPEQVKVLNRLLDGGDNGFENGISASQYQKVAKVSKATATRHLVQLVEKGCLVRMEGGGRSTRYRIGSIREDS